MPTHNFTEPRGRIVTFTVDAPSLRNLCGDPTARSIAVYLPEEYERSDRAYPLFVDLAGFTGSGLKRLAWTAFGESVPQRIDRLVHSGAMGPAIFVFPDGFTSLGGNQYVDTPAFGRWETFLARELVPHVEARFRILKEPRHRAVYGKSSGGYGALVQAFRHGDAWGAVASHSGDVGFDLVYRRDLPLACDAIAKAGSIAGVVEKVRAARKVSGSDMHALMILAMAASYDPDAAAPFGVRLPCDLRTCALDEQAWQRWLAHDPLMLARDPACVASAKRLGLLFVDCGSRDQYFIHYGSRALCATLEAQGVPVVYDEFDDDHSSVDYRLDVSLPRLFRAIQG